MKNIPVMVLTSEKPAEVYGIACRVEAGSFYMLSGLPVDVLKLDMEFVSTIHKDPKSYRLVEIIMDIAEYLGVPVIAEGVETEEQLKLVKQVGCQYVQGFYYSKPLPPSEIENLISCYNCIVLHGSRQSPQDHTEQEKVDQDGAEGLIVFLVVMICLDTILTTDQIRLQCSVDGGSINGFDNF